VSGDDRQEREEREGFDTLMPWAIGIGRRIVLRRGMLHHAKEIARVALSALCEALARHDPAVGKLRPFAAMWIVGEVNKALDREQEREANEVPIEEADRHDVHPTLHGEELVDDLVDGLLSLDIDEELRASCEAKLIKKEALAALHRAIESLEADDRRLVALHYWEEQTWKEVAQELGIAETTARERDARIRATLLSRIVAWDRVRPIRRKP
jgi:RNA polymerase sigma factor (sigma-70 family)